MSTTSLFAPVSWALFFWFRNSGMAIAARMPMMIMTTRSSIRVNPRSSLRVNRFIPNSFHERDYSEIDTSARPVDGSNGANAKGGRAIALPPSTGLCSDHGQDVPLARPLLPELHEDAFVSVGVTVTQ